MAKLRSVRVREARWCAGKINRKKSFMIRFIIYVQIGSQGKAVKRHCECERKSLH